MKAFTYLIIDLGCILFPLLLSFYKKWPFFKHWKAFLLANVLIGVPFLVWDELFTNAKIWGFNPDYLTGVYLFHLPLEEILFFICIPYACVFTYFALSQLVNTAKFVGHDKPIKIAFLALCSLALLTHFNHLYTSITAGFLLLFVLITWVKNIPIALIFASYAIITPFFLISNGILTGSFLESPIVWYNDEHNLGQRIFTIPFEDFFYGFLLVGSQCVLFDRFRKQETT